LHVTHLKFIFDKKTATMVIKTNANTTAEELKKLLSSSKEYPEPKKHFGKLKGVFGDGLTYQQNIRKDD